MRRSAINRAIGDALDCFARHSWSLPLKPRWDVTDFGLGDFERQGLTLVNLSTEPEYCEKLMFARLGQETPWHTHAKKKEDIICRVGELSVSLWPMRPDMAATGVPSFDVQVDGEMIHITAGTALSLRAGSRVTIVPGVWHSFVPVSAECIIGEVSTRNDDKADNQFLDPEVGRFPTIDEDEPAQVRLEGE